MTENHTIVRPKYPAGASTQAKFTAFDKANPWIYDALVTEAHKAQKRGFKTYGIDALWEHVRWNKQNPTTDGSSPWKMDDRYSSRYSRKIMENETTLRGFFKTRRIRTP